MAEGTQGAEVTPPTEAEVAEYLQFKEQVGLTAKQAAAIVDDYLKIKDETDKRPPVKAAEKEVTPEKPARKESDEKIREDLFGLVPEMKNLPLLDKKIAELEAQANENAKEKFVDATVRAEDFTKSWLAKELNVDLDSPEGQEYADVIVNRVGNAIFGSQARLDKLATGKHTVAREVLQEMQKAGQFKFDNIPKKAPPRPLPYMGRGNNPLAESKAVSDKELEGLTHEERLQKISDRLYPQVWR